MSLNGNIYFKAEGALTYIFCMYLFIFILLYFIVILYDSTICLELPFTFTISNENETVFQVVSCLICLL